ncbi:MAG TPA: VWA domain-containing protein, partial [Candidatus Eisenbacteria bacterium]|nr:VWA domain-containing protein [Candidatus Eisenbacteria bacterium]
MKSELSLTAEPVALLLIVAAIGVAVWAYVTRYPVLTPKRRNILLAARLLSLAALLIASLAPVARFPTASKERNRLLVLVDHSGSMEVTDAPGGKSRAAAADSAAAALSRELSGRYDVRVAPFDAALGRFSHGTSSLESAPAGAGRSRAGETALGDALRQATTIVDPDSVAAVVVLSDGAVNRGEDPEHALDPSLPAFALVVGSPDDPPTVGIAGVEAPLEAVLGRPSAVHVTVRQGKRPSAKGIVRITEQGRELSQAPFTLPGPGGSTR